MKRNGKNNISLLKKSPTKNGKRLKTNKPKSMPRNSDWNQKLLRLRQPSTQRKQRIVKKLRLNGTESSPSKPNSIRIMLMPKRTGNNYSTGMIS